MSDSRRSARSRVSETLPEAQLRLSPRQKLIAGLAGLLLMLQAGGIFAQLLVLTDSNDRIHAQDAKIGDLRKEVDPVLDVVRPLVQEARPLVRQVRGLTTPVGRTAEDLSAAAEEAPQVARAVRTIIGELQTFLPEVRAILPKATRFLDEVERRALLARADAAVSATLHLESLQTRQLRTARAQLAIQEETLAIQKTALQHIESLDRKTGGEFDPAR